MSGSAELSTDVALVRRTGAAADRAAGLAGDLALRLPDALVLGTALAMDAEVIATTDQRWSRYSDRVEVLA